jgi:hypothetical protein
LKKYVRYLQHGKRNAGRLQTRPRRRERARAHPPHAASDDLTTRQKYDLRYREKHRAKLLAYHREYYKKKRTQ